MQWAERRRGADADVAGRGIDAEVLGVVGPECRRLIVRCAGEAGRRVGAGASGERPVCRGAHPADSADETRIAGKRCNDYGVVPRHRVDLPHDDRACTRAWALHRTYQPRSPFPADAGKGEGSGLPAQLQWTIHEGCVHEVDCACGAVAGANHEMWCGRCCRRGGAAGSWENRSGRPPSIDDDVRRGDSGGRGSHRFQQRRVEAEPHADTGRCPDRRGGGQHGRHVTMCSRIAGKASGAKPSEFGIGLLKSLGHSRPVHPRSRRRILPCGP